MNLPTLGWLAKTLDAAVGKRSLNIPLASICTDSRLLQSGQVFWAIVGNRDGHDFVRDALKKGAECAVVDRAWGQRNPELSDKLIQVDNTYRALSNAAGKWRNQFNCPVVAITGSNGKTTTKNLTLAVLRSRLKSFGTSGNLNNEIGTPITILSIPSDAQAVVLELGAAKPHDIRYLCEISRPTHSLITSISAAHLRGFHTLEAVAETKGEIYDAVQDSGTAFVPLNDSLCVEQSLNARKQIGFSFQARPESWRGDFIHGEYLTFDRRACPSFKIGDIDFQLHIPGRPVAQAALAAATIATQLGISFQESAQALDSVREEPGRASLVETADFLIIDDSYNANPASMRSGIETLMNISAKRHIAILGDMLDLGETSIVEHRSLGEVAASSGVDVAIFVGEQSKHAYKAAQESGLSSFHFDQTLQLIEHVQELLRQGDAILVKGSRSMNMEKISAHLRQMSL